MSPVFNSSAHGSVRDLPSIPPPCPLTTPSLVFWLYMHINFQLMDCATSFIPFKALPFFVLTWVILNVTSTLFPFELEASFYKLGYAFPAHETWQVLVQIFSGGAVNRLYRALPILFAYEVLLLPLSKMAMHHRCVGAVVQEEQEMETVLTRFDRKGEESETETGRASSVTVGSSVLGLQRAGSVRSLASRGGGGGGDQYWPSVPVPFGGSLVKMETAKGN